ncbi:amino acid adenylation domain-containing protein [Lentzea sp. DG1S-22]|uniref:non-ribosomal peptide synthetase family protein n=1 Tax=Lentzea sp. DG1S-22 TaxID=3108822 RepID=UPI002E7A5B76|nr:amino acid adenylation domain-containing protein [Lentzea sp. DG1S-22]WVH82083.1 amino acid adenylation domain-containing protein [Lentzea sp. DG1S-22]
MSQQHELESMSAEEKRALLAQLLDGSAEAAPSNLSLEQRRLWVLLQLDESKPWQVNSAVRLSGRVDPATMQQALSAVVQRHEVLRSTFREVDGHPLATTAPAVTLRLPVVDIEADALEAELARVLTADTRTRFDLAKGPLVRASLLRLAEDDHVLLLTLHQMVADRRSAKLLTEELLARYTALAGGTSVDAAVASTDFHDLVVAQREWVNSDDAVKDVEFWRDRLAALSPLELPTDRPRPSMKTIHGDAVTVPVPDEVTRAVTAYCDQSGHFVSEVLLAAYVGVLSRYSQQHDLAVGISVPAAWHTDGDNLVGPLENTLPLRFEQGEADSLSRLTDLARTVRSEAMAHARLSFDRIVEAAQPQRDLSHTPLFQVSFTYEDETPSRQLPGAVATPLDLPATWTTHDLDLFAIRRGDALTLRVQYNTDLFDRSTAERFVGHVVLLLQTAAAEPDRPLSSIPLVTADESWLLDQWNETAAEHDRSRTLHALVEQAARTTPGTVAVAAGDDEVTYASLDARAEALAAELASHGAAPGTKIGVLVDRSVHAVVGLLGVLKTGAAYVPLDPSYPADRLEFIVGDAGVTLLVGLPAALAEVPAALGAVTGVPVPTADPARSADRPAVRVQPDDLAYIIYTSGSTGRPKGVAVEHRQIVHATAARTACEGPGLPQRYLVLAPLTFDASGGGLYWTLSRSGTVVLPTEQQVLDPRLLGKLIRSRGITHVDGVPSQYAVLLETDLEAYDEVRTTILAGETLPPNLVAEHYRRSPDAVLFNEYGPTEATIWASVHYVGPEEAQAQRVPIGRPVPNARIHLLDRSFNPVPPGVPGELYIGGEGVARGYVNRPAMTAERFLPDPFSARPGDRLYRTGDLARYRADGAIEFLGRVDKQVKIRGFRIELSEVENVLLRHPLVAEAVVTVREDQPGMPRLVAYVVPVIGRVLTQETLVSHVLGQIPDYMAPSHFVTLERMPLTRHGKIDTNALPAPQEIAVSGFVEPRDQLEAEIAETFAAVLGMQHISATADFFSLGGNSLLVARLAAQLSREHDVELPIDEIFRVPTVEGIARAVETHQRERDNVDSAALYAKQVAELVADVKLDPAIKPDGLPHADWFSPKNVLVTGATGYLGVFIVVELIERTDATVHCLVRGGSPDECWDRLEETMRKYRAWDESYRDRIKVVQGDLAKPYLGLSKEDFEGYAASIDSIYHSGAIVNFTYPYEAMKAANVLGTEELLRLATKTTLKAFHLVSSVDVFMGTGALRPFTEEDLGDRPVKVPTGYPRTKWVAEKIVVIARDRGVPVTVQRPWMITGHTKTGASHDTDYLYVYLKGFLDLGVLPLYNDVINAVPVDYTAQAIVYTSLREENLGKNFNITNREPTTMQQCYQWLRSFGYDLNVVDEEEARRQALAVDEDHILYPLTPILRVASMRHAALDPDLQQEVDPLDECRVLNEALEGSGIVCPPVNEQWAHSCFQFLVDNGYLPSPEEVAREKAHS